MNILLKSIIFYYIKKYLNMSVAILERKDNLHLLNSYVRAYKTNKLYKMKIYYRKMILRIVKKSILGTNFIYFYSKHGLFITAIFNMIIINLNFLLFPKLLYNSNPYVTFPEDNEFHNEAENFPYLKSFNFNKTFYIIFRLFIINLLDIIVLSFIVFNYNYKQKKINKYMEAYTQCAIGPENKSIRKHYNCNITNDGNFNIEINSSKNIKLDGFIKYNCNNFFEYVINVPNIRFFSRYIYKKILLPKEIEIINRIVAISNEIEYRYKKKLLRFLLIIVCIIIYIPLKNILFEEKKKDFLNYFGILILMLFVERNNFFKNKTEQIQKVSLLNNEYINNGYYIYINNDMISIFFIKEKYRHIESIEKIRELHDKLLYKFDLL